MRFCPRFSRESRQNTKVRYSLEMLASAILAKIAALSFNNLEPTAFTGRGFMYDSLFCMIWGRPFRFSPVFPLLPLHGLDRFRTCASDLGRVAEWPWRTEFGGYSTPQGWYRHRNAGFSARFSVGGSSAQLRSCGSYILYGDDGFFFKKMFFNKNLST